MHEIPPAKPTDAEDVAWGLQTAASLWSRGELSDAVAWLRRAAQAASDAQDDDRALELARLAAELADVVGAQGTLMPGAPMPSSVPVPIEEADEPTALDAIPTSGEGDMPVSSHLPSVPPAEKVHAGMFDPWSEALPPGASAPMPVVPAVIPPPPAFVEIPKAPITQPMFEPEEVVTSAPNKNAPSNSPAPRPAGKPAAIPPAGSRKPPPLPPRALATQAKKAPSPPLPPSPPISFMPPPEPAVDVAPRFPTPVPRYPTPPMSAPPPNLMEREALIHASDREDAASSADTTSPPPVAPFAPVTQPLGLSQLDEPDDMAPTPLAPAVRAKTPTPVPPPPEPEPEPAPEPPPEPAPEAAKDETPMLDLENVDAFSDLPDDARTAFAAAGKVNVLAEGDEVTGFALAYVMEGSFDVAATMVDAPAVRLARGAVLRSRGTTSEGVPMRIISAMPRGVIACWSTDAVETAFSNCPWVEQDLRAASDRVMTLVGITIGPLGERLDQSLREEIIGRLQVRPLVPGEIIVNKGEQVPGLILVGVGEIELVDGDEVKGIVGSGDFLFASEILSSGSAPYTARAGAGGALTMFGSRSIAQELMVTCPPLLEVFAGM